MQKSLKPGFVVVGGGGFCVLVGGGVGGGWGGEEFVLFNLSSNRNQIHFTRYA